MAWIAPMTAVANSVWTSTQYNVHVRDNLLASEAAVVTAAGQIVFSTAANTLAARTPNSAAVATSETTSTTSYTDLATTGPQVTITTGTIALIYVGCHMSNSTIGAASYMSYGVTSATSITALEDWGISWDGSAFASGAARIGAWHYVSNLNTGSNIFTAKYKVESGTGTFLNRELIVFPL